MVMCLVYSEGRGETLYHGDNKREAEEILKKSKGVVDYRIYTFSEDSKSINLMAFQYYYGRLWTTKAVGGMFLNLFLKN